MKFKLRHYQLESIDLLRESIKKGNKRPVLGLPTGAGKTVTFAKLAESALGKGSRVGVVCHRRELVEQARETLKSYGIDVSIVSFGMVQTYVRSPHKIPVIDLCIIDECHIGNFRRFIELLPDSTQVIGVTATPIASSKKNPLNKVFDDVVYPVQIRELIEQGFLSKPVYHLWRCDDSKLEKDFKGEFTTASQSKVFHLENLVEAYEKRVGKTIIFCSSIKQVEQIYEKVSTNIEEAINDKIFYVHSKMEARHRESVVSRFKVTEGAVIINCGILTAGFDDPSIQTVIVYRATTSIALWLQMVGRGSRVVSGEKDTFYIYDLGGNHGRLMPWEANRDWKSIFKLQGKNLKDKEAPLKKCVSCEAVIYASQMVCPYCSEKQSVKEKEEQKADRIEIIKSFQDLPEHLRVPFDQMSVPQLLERAPYGSPRLGRPFKQGWVLAQIKQRENAKELILELAKIKGYKNGWVQRQLTT